MTEAAGPSRGSGLVRSESGGEAIDEDYWPRLLSWLARLLALRVRAASATIPGAGGSGWIKCVTIRRLGYRYPPRVINRTA